MKPQIDVTDSDVQEACAAILREIVNGMDVVGRRGSPVDVQGR